VVDPEPTASNDVELVAGRRQQRRRALAEIPVLVAIALLVAFVLKTFVAQAFVIPSGSMEPQLQVGDRVVVSKLAYRLHDPRRGDIAVFSSPEPHAPSNDSPPVGFIKDVLEGVGLRQPDDDVLIKRVIALPGETVEGRAGHVYINGRQLIEPYLPAGLQTEDFPPTTVPDGDLWVMGDNRNNSRDSHLFGPIKESSVIGRAIAKVWPPGSISFL
jgi:signal peptidase I